jgi:hypothetical protein
MIGREEDRERDQRDERREYFDRHLAGESPFLWLSATLARRGNRMALIVAGTGTACPRARPRSQCDQRRACEVCTSRDPSERQEREEPGEIHLSEN